MTISSSGNAGIATSRAAEDAGVNAIVCVHPSTDRTKLKAIDGSTTTLVVTPRAINTAKRLARELGIPNLRPSTSPDALLAYGDIADELIRDADDLQAIVLFATSGATAVAVAERCIAHAPSVQVHVVQGEGNAALVDPASAVTDDSAHSAVAGRLGVRHSRLGDRMTAAISATGGRGWVVDQSAVRDGRALLAGEGIDASDESAANAFVASQLLRQGLRVACIVSGAPPRRRMGSAAARVLEVEDEWAALDEVRPMLAGTA